MAGSEPVTRIMRIIGTVRTGGEAPRYHRTLCPAPTQVVITEHKSTASDSARAGTGGLQERTKVQHTALGRWASVEGGHDGTRAIATDRWRGRRLTRRQSWIAGISSRRWRRRWLVRSAPMPC